MFCRINKYSMEPTKSKKDTPKIAVIVLSIMLLGGIFLGPLPQLLRTVDAQAENSINNNNNNNVDTSQVISQISTQLAKVDPSANVSSLQQLLTSLSIQRAQASSQTNALEDIHQISQRV